MTTHAIRRFQERVRPGLGWAAAEKALTQLLAHAELTGAAPAWLAAKQEEQAVAYLTLGDIVLPLTPSVTPADAWVIKTCLTRGGISQAAREKRNGHRRNSRRYGGGSRSKLDGRNASDRAGALDFAATA